MAKLNVNIGALSLKNPVMTASGTFGYGLEFADFMPLDGIGGIIVKGTTLKPREGNAELCGPAEQGRRLLLRTYLSANQGYRYQYDSERQWLVA